MKKMISRRNFLAAAGVVAAAGVLTACGGSSSSSAASTGSSDAAASGDTIKVGVLGPMTGDVSVYGLAVINGASLYLKQTNEAGGINGKQVVLKSFDSKNDAKEAAEVARLICQDKTILATIGDFSSTCCMATAPIYEENKTVQISPSAGLIDFPRVGPYNFSTTGVQENDGGFLMNRVINEKMGAKSVAIVYTNNDYGLNMLSYMTQEAEADGVVITDTEAIASGEKDFTAIVSKMRQTEPEAVAIVGSYNEVANCVKQIRQVGWDVPVAISGSALTDQLVELLGDDVNDIYSNIAFVASDNTPETKEFNEEFTKRANMPPSFHSISTYDTVMLVCDAAIKCGDNLNRETLKDAIQSYKGFDGLMGPFEFTEDGAVYRGYKVVQYQDGVLTSVSDYMMVHD